MVFTVVRRGEATHPLPDASASMACGEATPYTYLNLDGVIETYLVAASFGAHVADILTLPVALVPCNSKLNIFVI